MHPQSITPVTLAEQERLALVMSLLESPGQQRPRIDSDLAISYARVSKSVQVTLRDQHRYNARTALRLTVIVDIELEDEESGLRRDRAAYQELLHLAEQRRHGWLLVYKADRLSRDDVEFVTTVLKLYALGMRIWDYRHGEITPRNARELAQQAWRESRNTADRTQDKLEMQAEDGVKLGSTRLGYVHVDPPDRDHSYPLDEEGRPDQYRPDPVVGPLITELFERAAADEPLTRLRTWFNGKTGRRMTTTDLKKILRCEYYAGLTVGCKTRKSRLDSPDGKAHAYARPRDEWKTSRHRYPLTDWDTFQRVQARLQLKAQQGQDRGPNARYALQGVLWCGRCGKRMHGQADKRVGGRYRCDTCGSSRLATKLELAIRSCLERYRVSSHDAAAVAAERLGQQREDLTEQIDAAAREVSQLTRQRTTLYERLDQGIIDAEQYRAQIRKLDAKRDDARNIEATLRQELLTLPQLDALVADIAADRAGWIHWPEKIPAMEIEAQQEVYRKCCKRVVLEPDANTLTVDYTGEMAVLMGEERHTVQLLRRA